MGMQLNGVKYCLVNGYATQWGEILSGQWVYNSMGWNTVWSMGMQLNGVEYCLVNGYATQWGESDKILSSIE